MMEHRPYLEQTVKYDQKLIMNFAMQKAFTVLQMPTMELSHWLENECEQNPLISIFFSTALPYEDRISYPTTLNEHLEKEIRHLFHHPLEKQVAYFIAGSLDAKGFLTLSIEELCEHTKVSPSFLHKVLTSFRKIEPIGLGSTHAQEALLTQLEAQNEANTLFYQILSEHFEDFIHQRWNKIAKISSLSPAKLQTLIKEKLKNLNPFPGLQFESSHTLPIYPDLKIESEEGHYKTSLLEDFSPQIEISSYKNLSEEEPFFRRYLASAKWLIRILDKRKKILLEIGQYLGKHQCNFLEGIQARPTPLTRRHLAASLNLSESTITRAIQGKYIETPRGIMALAEFFSHALSTTTGLISNESAKDLLLKLIQNENKKSPFSDQALSDLLHTKGIICARRTVAKYRKELAIDSKHKRKKWNHE